MSINQSPKIVTDGLVLYYDMINGKAFKGGPVTNLLPNPSTNGLPTTGSGWGTYNTNQYNGAAYFSIGSISSVSSNIVTTSSNHPLRSYDVVTPQSSGGGLYSGANYLIKKLSATTFSLHTWNGSQDGSQGYINPATGNHKVYDDFANDVRVVINASSFPTMWWGPPHLPNSALVKEIISKGFNGLSGIEPTDCIRLHFIRSDNVTDGMAYGVDTPVTAGVAHTVSFWTRSVTPSAVGQNLGYSIYNYGVVSPAGYSYGAVLGAVGVWTKHSLTFTPVNPTCISYWFASTGMMKADLANIQFEVGSVANNFAPGTRSSTQAITDLTNKNTITASSLTYAADGTFSFNGSNNFVDGGSSSDITITNNITVSAWVRRTAYTGGSSMIIRRNDRDTYALQLGISTPEVWWKLYFGSGNWGQTATTSLALNEWANIVGTYDRTTMRLYKNGVQVQTLAATSAIDYSGSVAPNLIVGRDDPVSGRYFSGNIPSIQIYNRALSAAEVQQNFNAHRSRYGI